MLRLWLTVTVILLLSYLIINLSYAFDSLNSWRGKSAASLRKAWGTPFYYVRHQDGSSTYVYKSNAYRMTPKVYSPRIGVQTRSQGGAVIVTESDMNPGTEIISNECYANFNVNSQNRIVSVRVDGQNCNFNQSVRH